MRRRTVAFGPHLLGVERLELLVLLSGSPPVNTNPAILPSPVPGSTAMDTLAQFQTDTTIVEGQTHVQIQNATPALAGPDEEAIIDQLNAARAAILNSLNLEQAQTTLALTSFFRADNMMTAANNADQTAYNKLTPAQQAGDAGKQLKANIAYRAPALTIAKAAEDAMNAQLKAISKTKDGVNAAFDKAIQSIRAVPQPAPPPPAPPRGPVYVYYADSYGFSSYG